MNKKGWISLVIIVLIAIIAVPIYYTAAWYSSRQEATGTITLKDGIVIEYEGLRNNNGVYNLILGSNTTGTYSNAAPGEQIDVTQVKVWQSNKTTSSYSVLRFQLTYSYSTDGSHYTVVPSNNANLHIETNLSVASNFILNNGWYYYVTNPSGSLTFSNLAVLGDSTSKLNIFDNTNIELNNTVDPNFYIKIEITFEALQNSEAAVSADNWFAAS